MKTFICWVITVTSSKRDNRYFVTNENEALDFGKKLLDEIFENDKTDFLIKMKVIYITKKEAIKIYYTAVDDTINSAPSLNWLETIESFFEFNLEEEEENENNKN